MRSKLSKLIVLKQRKLRIAESLYKIVMPFGLTKALATFQRLMNSFLVGLTSVEVLVYLDNVLVFAETFSKLLLRLRLVLECFRAAGMRCKPSKCQLFIRQVKYLSHIVGNSKINYYPSKIAKVA